MKMKIHQNRATTLIKQRFFLKFISNQNFLFEKKRKILINRFFSNIADNPNMKKCYRNRIQRPFLRAKKMSSHNVGTVRHIRKSAVSKF